MAEDGDEQSTPDEEQTNAAEQAPADEPPAPSPESQAPAAEQQAPSPEEEELRKRLEEELRKLRVEDVLLQSVVSLINLTSRRIAKPDEQDLEQARVGIEAVRALADLLDAEPAAQVREALSQLQVAYAREAGGAPPGETEPEGGAGPPPGGPQDKPPSGLWTPHDRG